VKEGKGGDEEEGEKRKDRRTEEGREKGGKGVYNLPTS